MGTSLTGVKIKDSYDSLLKVTDNGPLDGSLQVITDGLGNNSALSLSTAGASVGGTLAVSGNAAFDTNTLFVDAANNRVGVGTASPSEPLEVAGSNVMVKINAAIDSFAQLGFYEAGALKWNTYNDFNNDNYSIGNSGGTRLSITTAGDISFRDSSANEAFYWDASAANLGIGESSPTAKLHLKAVNDGGASNVAIIQNQGIATGTESRLFFLQGGTVTRGGYISGYNESSSGSPTSLIFATSAEYATPTERMRITSGGFLKASNNGSYINTTGVFHELRAGAISNQICTMDHTASVDPYGLIVKLSGASPNNTTNFFINCEDSTQTKFIVWSNGDAVNRNNSYGALSDAKLKENVTDASPKLEDLMQVKVRNFNYIGDDKKQLGVIAQELEEIFPALVNESQDFEEVEVPQLDENGQEVLDENGEVVMTKERVDLGTVTKSVKYSVFVPMLIKAIQELNAKVESLEAQLNA